MKRGSLNDGRQSSFPRSSLMARARWLDVGLKVIVQVSARHNKQTIADAMRTSKTEHMTVVDTYDGARGREGKGADESKDVGEGGKEEDGDGETIDLLQAAPVVDGRLRNVAKE